MLTFKGFLTFKFSLSRHIWVALKWISASLYVKKTCSKPCTYALLYSGTFLSQDMAGPLLKVANGDVLLCVQACDDGWYLHKVLFVDQINQRCRAGDLITFPSARDKPDREKCTMKPSAQPVVTALISHFILCSALPFGICVCQPPPFHCSLMLH